MEEQSSGNVKSTVREASSSQPGTAEGAQVRGRISPISALLAGQISQMLAKRKQCHLEDEQTANPAAAEAWLGCLAWH